VRKLKPEDQIISGWKGDIDQPIVSICCMTYNQENYIEDALEGFLSQKTDFAFEIIIHDDASTDRTVEIISEYKSRYKKIITLICQSENQYSKNIIVLKNALSATKGKYIALCHGDDYWISNEKLQRQVKVMSHYKVGLCGHPAQVIDIKDEKRTENIGKVVSQEEKFTLCDLIIYNKTMLPFASIMIDKLAKNDLLKFMPPVLGHGGIQMLASVRNGLVILPEIMSIYRKNVPGCTTDLVLGDSVKRRITSQKRIKSIKSIEKMIHGRCYLGFRVVLTRQLKHLIGDGCYRYFEGMKILLSGEAAISSMLIIVLSIPKISYLCVRNIINFLGIKILIRRLLNG